MSVKEKRSVDAYTKNVAALANHLEALKAFLETLPAPDDNGHLPSPMHYGHLGTVDHVTDLVQQAAEAVDGFWDAD